MDSLFHSQVLRHGVHSGKGCLGAGVGFVLYQKQYVKLLLMAGEP